MSFVRLFREFRSVIILNYRMDSTEKQEPSVADLIRKFHHDLSEKLLINFLLIAGSMIICVFLGSTIAQYTTCNAFEDVFNSSSSMMAFKNQTLQTAGHIQLEAITLEFFIRSDNFCNLEKGYGMDESMRSYEVEKLSNNFYKKALEITVQYGVNVTSHPAYHNVTQAIWNCITLKQAPE
jgi:hypothetical protein